MKAVKLVAAAFGYFCVATVLAQAGLACALWAKGWFTRERLILVVGALEGKQLPGAEDEGSKAPETNSWELLEKETARLAAADGLLKSRAASADGSAKLVRDEETRLDTDRTRFDEMRQSFDQALADLERQTLEAGLQDVRQTIENMSPKQAKDHLLRMFAGGAQDDLVKVFSSLSIEKRKKIVGEFRTPAEQQTLHEILREVRLSQAPDPAPEAASPL
jgi:hypothetical protein